MFNASVTHCIETSQPKGKFFLPGRQVRGFLENLAGWAKHRIEDGQHLLEASDGKLIAQVTEMADRYGR